MHIQHHTHYSLVLVAYPRSMTESVAELHKMLCDQGVHQLVVEAERNLNTAVRNWQDGLADNIYPDRAKKVATLCVDLTYHIATTLLAPETMMDIYMAIEYMCVLYVYGAHRRTPAPTECMPLQTYLNTVMDIDMTDAAERKRYQYAACCYIGMHLTDDIVPASKYDQEEGGLKKHLRDDIYGHLRRMCLYTYMMSRHNIQRVPTTYHGTEMQIHELERICIRCNITKQVSRHYEQIIYLALDECSGYNYYSRYDGTRRSAVLETTEYSLTKGLSELVETPFCDSVIQDSIRVPRLLLACILALVYTNTHNESFSDGEDTLRVLVNTAATKPRNGDVCIIDNWLFAVYDNNVYYEHGCITDLIVHVCKIRSSAPGAEPYKGVYADLISIVTRAERRLDRLAHLERCLDQNGQNW